MAPTISGSASLGSASEAPLSYHIDRKTEVEDFALAPLASAKCTHLLYLKEYMHALWRHVSLARQAPRDIDLRSQPHLGHGVPPCKAVGGVLCAWLSQVGNAGVR